MTASSLTAIAGMFLALLLPVSVLAADRDAEGGVVVLASHAGQNGIGAGTIVEKTGTRVRVITAGHVATFGVLEIRLSTGSVAAAHLVAVIPGRDLAVIEADLSVQDAAELKPARVASPRSAEAVHVWGSGNDGPAYETGTIGAVGTALPDGAAHGRYALGCALCHQGDSGAGIFNARAELVGVYIGYFEVETGRLSIAESPAAAVTVALQDDTNAQVSLAPNAMTRPGNGRTGAKIAPALGKRSGGERRHERTTVAVVAERFAR